MSFTFRAKTKYICLVITCLLGSYTMSSLPSSTASSLTTLSTAFAPRNTLFSQRHQLPSSYGQTYTHAALLPSQSLLTLQISVLSSASLNLPGHSEPSSPGQSVLQHMFLKILWLVLQWCAILLYRKREFFHPESIY